MEKEPGFFDFAAEVGLTKHVGGVEATEALIELCHIAGAASALLVEVLALRAIFREEK
jgi:hypothetical protein